MRTLDYAGDGTPAHALDLYLPQAVGPHPLVVWVHGGGWLFGDKDQLATGEHGMTQWRDALLAQGYAVASVNYRLSGVARHPAQVEDVCAAVRYLRRTSQQLNIDPSRVAVAGESAGGHLALMVAMSQDAGPIGAVLSFYGVTDLARLHADQAAHPGCDCASARSTSPEGQLLGYDPATPARAAQATEASPMGHVSASTPPTYLTHGRGDCTVPPIQSQRLHDALQAAGRPVALTLIDGSHADSAFYTTAESVDPALAFLAEHLSN